MRALDKVFPLAHDQLGVPVANKHKQPDDPRQAKISKMGWQNLGCP
jgi:hypothetical protein